MITLAIYTGVSVGSSNFANRPEATIQQGLRRIVTIRQQQMERYGEKLPGPPVAGNRYEPAVKLLEAEGRLAQAQGREREAQDKLRQIVSVRQEQYRSVAERSDLLPAAKENVLEQLHEAELNFAVATGNNQQAQKSLDKIVDLNQRKWERLRRLEQAGQRDTAVETAEIDLLESQIQRAEFQLLQNANLPKTSTVRQ